MASGSRSPTFLGWFRRGPRFGSLIAVLWWQEQLQMGVQIVGISHNKAELWSFAALVVLHAAGRSSSTFSVKLSWRKMREEESGAGSFNKCVNLRFGEFGAGIFLLAGRGGEGEKENSPLCAGSRRWW